MTLHACEKVVFVEEIDRVSVSYQCTCGKGLRLVAVILRPYSDEPLFQIAPNVPLSLLTQIVDGFAMIHK